MRATWAYLIRYKERGTLTKGACDHTLQQGMRPWATTTTSHGCLSFFSDEWSVQSAGVAQLVVARHGLSTIMPDVE